MTKRIMIVDDEHDILTSLKTILERHNYEVITVENGIECVREVERGFKGIILLDIMMPEMDGWDTLRELINRGLMKGISIEIITANGTKNHEKMRGLESYIQDYLTKPINIEELISSIKKCNIIYLKDIHAE